MKILIIILSFVTTISLGQKKYSITKNDFISQFSDSSILNRIFCVNKKGEKVWILYTQDGYIITLGLLDSKKEIKLFKPRFINGGIEGQKLTALNYPGKVVNVNLDNILFISLQSNNGIEVPYYSLDSSNDVFKYKNDSLIKNYSSGTQFIIKLLPKKDIDKDSFLILENACFCINFKDNTQINNGIIAKLTKDSIYLYNSFDSVTAKYDNLEYKILQYHINDIKELKLLKGGGYSYKTISTKDYELIFENVEKSKITCPCKFKINPLSGAVELYRKLLTLNGFIGLTEKGGKLYWDEN